MYSPAALPDGTTPIGGSLFLTTDGRVVDGSTGVQYAADVASFGQLYRKIAAGEWAIGLKKKDGSCTYLLNGTESAASNVPSGSTPIASSKFLSPDGRLIDGGVVDGVAGKVYWPTDIAACGQMYSIDNNKGWRMPLRLNDGSFYYLETGSGIAASSIPANSVPAASSLFLTPDARLVDASTGNTCASDVDSYGLIYRDIPSGTWRIPLKKKDGTASYLQDGSETAASGVPSGSSPAGGSLFLTTDGRVIDGSNGSTVTSGVSSFGQLFNSDTNGNWSIALMAQTC